MGKNGIRITAWHPCTPHAEEHPSSKFQLPAWQLHLRSPLNPSRPPAAAPAAAVLAQSPCLSLSQPTPSSTPKYSPAMLVMVSVRRPTVITPSRNSAFCLYRCTTCNCKFVNKFQERVSEKQAESLALLVPQQAHTQLKAKIKPRNARYGQHPAADGDDTLPKQRLVPLHNLWLGFASYSKVVVPTDWGATAGPN